MSSSRSGESLEIFVVLVRCGGIALDRVEGLSDVGLCHCPGHCSWLRYNTM